MVETERTVNGETVVERHYYISSRALNAKECNASVRKHWSIENGLHWVLDAACPLVNYEMINEKDKVTYKNSWITVDNNNVARLARGGRCRWKIENECFNTLKNQGYHLEYDPSRFEQPWLRPKSRIKGLYLTGQDTLSCGVAGAMISGVATAQSVLGWRRGSTSPAGPPSRSGTPCAPPVDLR